MDSKLNNKILDFINENFANNRKVLKSKIDEYLIAPYKTINFNDEFKKKITTPIYFQSLNAIKKKRKRNEIGDISDVWTFYLNEDLKQIEVINEYEDWDCENYLKKGKELHLCKVWINWFLDIYYIETSYHKKSNSIEENGKLTLNLEYEKEIFSQILKILNGNNLEKIEINFSEYKIKNVKTDCNDNPTIFDCLFSDIIHPTKNSRTIRKKISDIEVIILENLNEKREVLNKQMMFGNGNYNNFRIDFDNTNKIIRTLDYKQIQKYSS